MPTRAWVRSFEGFSAANGQETELNTPFITQGMLAPTVNATLIRSICDIGATITVDTGAGASPGPGWWAYVNIRVAIGRDDYPSWHPYQMQPGDGSPLDPRVTGMGSMYLTTVQQDQTAPAKYHATYRLSRVIDTAGKRKPMTGGVQPIYQCTADIQTAGNTIAPGVHWLVQLTGYHGALWETP